MPPTYFDALLDVKGERMLGMGRAGILSIGLMVAGVLAGQLMANPPSEERLVVLSEPFRLMVIEQMQAPLCVPWRSVRVGEAEPVGMSNARSDACAQFARYRNSGIYGGDPPNDPFEYNMMTWELKAQLEADTLHAYAWELGLPLGCLLSLCAGPFLRRTYRRARGAHDES
ncbi:hypothetical protein JY96_20925 [Aquabacterium sp. NJ1]|nr:hypothetical protein JY96_20925 [Aquabacterium sp. NJ1]